MPTELSLAVLAQPNDEACGPTCLHAVYRFLDDSIPLAEVIAGVTTVSDGGTLAAYLGLHALGRGYKATLYTYDLELFDPTWFEDPRADLEAVLKEQRAVKSSPSLHTSTDAYLQFLRQGGRIRHEELGPDLIRRYLAKGLPMMTGLSATYLYGSARERYEAGRAIDDPIRGGPTGHFVLLHGYDPSTDSVLVADPLHDNPLADGSRYRVGIMRLLGAIMLGVLSYDGNLLVVEQAESLK